MTDRITPSPSTRSTTSGGVARSRPLNRYVAGDALRAHRGRLVLPRWPPRRGDGRRRAALYEDWPDNVSLPGRRPERATLAAAFAGPTWSSPGVRLRRRQMGTPPGDPRRGRHLGSVHRQARGSGCPRSRRTWHATCSATCWGCRRPHIRVRTPDVERRVQQQVQNFYGEEVVAALLSKRGRPVRSSRTAWSFVAGVLRVKAAHRGVELAASADSTIIACAAPCTPSSANDSPPSASARAG
ncbi:hypothetical protein HBB16_19605 [Pseudonocardia sp. MCCB 268]|nr:hypothetical protein [Pseudonocardia cytotoxica]